MSISSVYESRITSSETDGDEMMVMAKKQQAWMEENEKNNISTAKSNDGNVSVGNNIVCVVSTGDAGKQKKGEPENKSNLKEKLKENIPTATGLGADSHGLASSGAYVLLKKKRSSN